MYYDKILLDKIFNKTGIYITNKNECKLLSQIIANEKIGYLSESTLYRFFLYPNGNHNPYKNTLNILAQFCGYASWDNFVIYCDSVYLFTDANFLNKTFDTIISGFVNQEKFNSLIDVFDSVSHENYKTKEYIGLRTFISFQKTTSFSTFVKKYGQHDFVRNILLESLYDPFHRIQGYTDSFQYYLESTHPSDTNYLQDYIFANAVLFRYFYFNDILKAKEIGKKLYGLPISSNELDTIYIFPKARYVAYKMWYLHLNEAKKNTIIDYLDEVYYFIENEFNKSNLIIEINIVYETFIEVVQQLNLVKLEEKINTLYDIKIKSLKISNLSTIKPMHSNGLLNILK
jgi:hypothetical protein